MKILAAALLLTVAPCIALAEDAVPPPVGATTATQVRFFPLDNARANRPGRVKEIKPLRSDSGAMTDGYFRIDRSRTMPLRNTGPLIVHPQAVATDGMPRVIRGPGPSDPTPAQEASATTTAITPNFTSSSNDPVLSLFESQASAPSSFRTALTGRSGASTLMPHQWPIAPTAAQKLSSNYGFRSDPFDKSTKFHGGIDIAAPIGTPVLASADGQVASIGDEGGYGKSITLLHPDGSESKYSHLSSQTVRQGQYVKSGQTIGAVGTSGHSTGPHLDYRLSQDGVSIDPTKLTAADNTLAPQPVAAATPIAPPVRRLSVETARSERVIVVR